MLKPLAKLEARLDRSLEKVFSSAVFLRGVSSVLNFNSYRKILVNRGLTATWKLLQLPNKRDQERTLHLLNELHFRVCELEDSLEARPAKSGEREWSTRRTLRSQKKRARADTEPVSIQ